MERIKIVVWDNIGNVLLGVRPWERWTPTQQARMLADDPAAREHAPSFEQIFAGWPIDVTWLYNPDRRAPSFPQMYEENEAILCDAGDPEAAAAAIQGADIVILHKESVEPAVLRQASRLRLIQHLGQDIRGIPLDVARERGIPVAAIPLTNYLSVAEHAWAMILGHFKRLPQQRAHMQTRRAHESWGNFPGQQFAYDQTLGLVGLGEIARPLARMARASEMRVSYWDRVRFPELEEQLGLEFLEWDDLFRQSDVLSVQLALNPQTEGIIGARDIGLMKPTALFVNTARGKLVDQVALTAALRERRIGGAALEVFAEEPLPPDDPLLHLHDDLDNNITLTPHCSSLAPASWLRDSQAVWFNVLRALRGEGIRWQVGG
jgi:phosphoglycerate dehydrogenase-like enzyme